MMLTKCFSFIDNQSYVLKNNQDKTRYLDIGLSKHIMFIYLFFFHFILFVLTRFKTKSLSFFFNKQIKS